MNQIVITPFDIKTTQFGFGCSSMLGLLSGRESRMLIDAAYEAGIRHFDVARSYGHGSAEELLGRTLGVRRSNVTITTKFGLPVPHNQALVRAARALARPLVKRFSSMRERSRSALHALAPTVDFDPRHASESLATSLRELRSGHVELFLLHEVRAELLTDNRLLDFLRKELRAGRIKGYGVGSDFTVLPGLIRSHPEYCPVVQHACSIFTPHLDIPVTSFRICHGALLRSFDVLMEKLKKDGKLISDKVGLDLSNPVNLSALLLRSAVLRNPGALTLFSARSVQRIQHNVESLANIKLDPQCEKLIGLIANGTPRGSNEPPDFFR